MAVVVIGESLNATIPAICDAVKAHDTAYIQKVALEQVEADSDYLDLNAQVTGRDELIDLPWMIESVRAVTNIPMVLDSSNPPALKHAMETIDWKGQYPVLSSINNKKGSAQNLLPLAAKYNTGIVALLLDDTGINHTAKGRFAICKELVAKSRDAGVPDHNLWIDPLILPLGTDDNVGPISFDLLQMMKAEFPQVRTFCGLSNVSFGMPHRALMNRTYVAMLAANGMEGFMINPRVKEMRAMIYAIRALMGEDEKCGKYIQAHRDGLLLTPMSDDQKARLAEQKAQEEEKARKKAEREARRAAKAENSES
ncbi:MAG: dihydropteroate synthase [Pseudomonadales bacterium]|jgi:5-methyltetrahydrofolate--homocysteine methyltransferase|nr:dihydropteroate synthase [Pseudomonadales bacterium]